MSLISESNTSEREAEETAYKELVIRDIMELRKRLGTGNRHI